MKRRSLWPREHGAYVQLATPLVVALVLAPSLAGALLATGACAAFLAHEPLLVLLGRRGKRARVENEARALVRLTTCLAVAGVGGVAGMALAPGALAAGAAVGLAAGVVVGLSWLDEAHTLGGEVAAAAALAAAAAPVGVAGGMPIAVAVELWAMWALAFASTVVAVHVVIDCHKRRASRRTWLLWLSLLAAAGAGLALGSWPAGAPLWLVSLAVIVVRPRATQLRRIGVLLAVVTAVTAAWTIAAA